MSVFDYVWAKDNSRLALAVAPRNLVDDSYMFKRIYLLDPNRGDMKQLVDNPGKLGQMEWSPDGKHIAFVSAVDISDPVNGSLFIMSVPNTKKFTELMNYSKDFKGSVKAIRWKDSKTVLFSSDENVNTVISTQRVGASTRTVLLAGGKVTFSSFSYGAGAISFSGSTPKHPNELYTLVGKKLTRHTHSNPWLDKKKLSKQEPISYKSRDGWDIDGVLLYPLGYEAGKKYPLICYIHGRPESCVKNGWSTYYSMWGQVATANGYFVFMPNYRGSSGKGVAFSKADQGDMGDEEFNDVIDGIKYLVDKGMVDKSKVGIGGGSYG
ncbi:MAG: S9 family peptidase, partial [Candidatus Krumholzibacteriota bacterium]|nr:S9 family peptidase [Candidatus Krumholzibacteriota bacterium]